MLGKLHSWQKHWSRKCKQKPKELEGMKKRKTQYSQNKMFKEDTKKIYRNLGMKNIRGLLEKYPTFGREKETGLLGALDT